MSRITQVNGDYRIQVTAGGNIILDSSNAGVGPIGNVTIYGNLDVKGTTTYVESTNTEIKDNILQLNYGQTGNGISSTNNYVSGIEIERGNYSAAQLLFNETVNHYNPVTSSTVAGTFVMRTADGTLSGLQLASLANSGTTNFVFDLQNTGYALSLVNTGNDSGTTGGQLGEAYADSMDPLAGQTITTHNNYIPNRRFVTKYVAATGGVATVDRIYFPTTGTISTSTSSIEAFASSIVFQISQVTKAVISAAGVTVNDINLYQDTISNVSANNLILTASNNNVEVNAVLNLDNQTSNPSYPSSATALYSKSTIGPGKTGLYFTNAGAAQIPDELVSRSRAVALSILL